MEWSGGDARDVEGGPPAGGWSRWQGADGLAAAVLRAVFGWLRGAELARAGGVCRAWRAAALDPALWRRLLHSPWTDAHLSSLYADRRWREEYVHVHAGWAMRGRRGTGGARLLHAALAPCGTRLALANDDADIMVWEMDGANEWHERLKRGLRARGWSSVARAQWPAPRPAPAAGSTPATKQRLLIAGPLAGVQRWELLVLEIDENGEDWLVASRAGCSGGAAGCWAGRAGDAYLSLELRRLSAEHYATTVWLNAATQETQSEYAGVTTPLLRVYNEDKANITHIMVTEVPLGESAISGNHQSPDQVTIEVLLAGFSGASGALRVWPLPALQPPPLLAAGAGDLRERLQRARARRAEQAERAERGDEPADEPQLDEAAARALCSPHDYEYRLDGPLVGFTLQPDGRAVWACTGGARAACLSLPQLRPLRALAAPSPCPSPAARRLADASPLADLHYVQPALSDRFFAAPAGGRSGLVWAWSVRSGCVCPAPLPHPAPALAVVALPHATPTIFVIAANEIFEWESRATRQPSPQPHCSDCGDCGHCGDCDACDYDWCYRTRNEQFIYRD